MVSVDLPHVWDFSGAAAPPHGLPTWISVPDDRSLPKGKGKDRAALKSRLWNFTSHFLHVLLVRASHEASAESRAGEIEFAFWWEKLQIIMTLLFHHCSKAAFLVCKQQKSNWHRPPLSGPLPGSWQALAVGSVSECLPGLAPLPSTMRCFSRYICLHRPLVECGVGGLGLFLSWTIEL